MGAAAPIAPSPASCAYDEYVIKLSKSLHFVSIKQRHISRIIAGIQKSLMSSMKLELHNVLRFFLNFSDFEPQYSYKLYSCKEIVYDENGKSIVLVNQMTDSARFN